MALVVIPATEASVYTDATPSPLDRARKMDPAGQLGSGLLRPFRRDQKSDFANASGEALVRACVGQVLGMQGAGAISQGELPWAPERGSLLYLLRHQANDLVLQNLGRQYVIDALRAFEPRIRVRATRITREKGPTNEENVLLIRVVYDVLATPQPSNLVIFPGVDQTVSLSQAA